MIILLIFVIYLAGATAISATLRRLPHELEPFYWFFVILWPLALPGFVWFIGLMVALYLVARAHHSNKHRFEP